MSDDTSKPLDPNDLPEFWCIKPRTKTEWAYIEGGKKCTKCGKWKPLSEYHSSVSINVIANRTSWCKRCRNSQHVIHVTNGKRRSRSVRMKETS